MKKILVCCTLLLLFGCSSRSLKKDYKIIDASQQDIPAWVSDLPEWLEQQDTKKNNYYFYESEAKNSRAISCEIAKARSMALVAEEISTFIKQSFAQSTEGDPTSTDEKLSEYVEDSLLKVVKANIRGARTHKVYWEKRRFQKDLGSKKDYEGFVCSSLTKISKKNLKRAFKRSQKKLEAKAQNASKKRVKEVLDNAAKKI